MIFGDHYSVGGTVANSSGWAETTGDDLFIAGGKIDSIPGKANDDRAVAGTVLHELGHGLCLSRVHYYMEQGSECMYAGIDNNSGNAPDYDPDDYFNLENYESVMNYRYQLTDEDDLGSVELSQGSNGTDDHNDWEALKNHVRAFNGSRTPTVEYGARSSGASHGTPLSADGVIVVD